MECEVLVGHGPNGKPAVQQPLEVGADVGGAVLVPIERNRAVSLCATPQTPDSPSRLRLLLLPRPACAQAPAARLGCVRLVLKGLNLENL